MNIALHTNSNSGPSQRIYRVGCGGSVFKCLPGMVGASKESRRKPSRMKDTCNSILRNQRLSLRNTCNSVLRNQRLSLVHRTHVTPSLVQNWQYTPTCSNSGSRKFCAFFKLHIYRRWDNNQIMPFRLQHASAQRSRLLAYRNTITCIKDTNTSFPYGLSESSANDFIKLFVEISFLYTEKEKKSYMNFCCSGFLLATHKLHIAMRHRVMFSCVHCVILNHGKHLSPHRLVTHLW